MVLLNKNFAESFDSKESKMKRNRIKICKIEVWKEDNLIIAHVMTIMLDDNVSIMRIAEECKHVYFLSHNHFQRTAMHQCFAKYVI